MHGLGSVDLHVGGHPEETRSVYDWSVGTDFDCKLMMNCLFVDCIFLFYIPLQVLHYL